MSAILDDSDRFWLLADAVCMGTASDEELHELEARVIADENARRLYLAYCQLDAVLELELGGSRAGESVREKIQSELPDATPAGLVIAAPKVSPREPMGPISIVVGPTSRRTDDDFSAGWPMAYLASAVICAIGLLIFALIPIHHHEQVANVESPTGSHSLNSVEESSVDKADEPLDTSLPPLIGRITGMVDCKWSDPQTEASNGASVPLGRKYALSSGLMQITYDTGAKVILQGPCTYEVESKTGGYLSLGKLTAKLEKKNTNSPLPSDGRGAGGEGSGDVNSSLPTTHNPLSTAFPLSTLHSPLFTITTPTATVTDLGTEFGVEVDPTGVTESHVFKGVVKVTSIRASERDSDSDQEVILRADESVRVERPNSAEADQRMAMMRKTAEPARFIRKLPLSKKPLSVQVLAYFHLGEDDPGAKADQPVGERTMNHSRSRNLDKYGSPTYTADTAAPGSSLAMNFRGIEGEYLYSRYVYASVNDDFILEAWCRPQQLGESPMYIVYNGHGRTDGYGLAASDHGWVCLKGGTGAINTDVPCEIGQWVHVALVCEHGTLQFWMNGKCIKTLGTVLYNLPSGSFTIGGAPEVVGLRPNAFHGEIDEVRISQFRGPFNPKMFLFQQPEERRK